MTVGSTNYNLALSSSATAVTLTVSGAVIAPTITSHPTNTTVTAGQTATFTVVASGTAPLTYQWKQGTTNVGINSATLNITNAQSANAGSYTCVVTNSAGTATSNAATLTVTTSSLPLVTVTTSDGSAFEPVKGYTVSNSDTAGGPIFAWVDISFTGTPISLNDQTNAGPFPIGFNFPFFGQNMTSFRIHSDGWLTFSATYNANSGLVNGPYDVIAMLMADLNPGRAGQVLYQQTDANTLIVQYQQVPFTVYAYGTATFQAILKSDGTITLQYLQIGNPLSYAIGIKNSTGSLTYKVAERDPVPFVHSNLAVRFTPLAAPLVVDPGSFTLTRTGSTTTSLDVAFSLSGSATNGLDYATLPLVVTIPAGQASASIAVTPLQDALSDNGEVVILKIVSGPGYDAGALDTATVDIYDQTPSTLQPLSLVSRTSTSLTFATPQRINYYGSQIAFYEVMSGATVVATWTLAAMDNPPLSVTGLTPETTYTLTVRGVDGAGHRSSESMPGNFRTTSIQGMVIVRAAASDVANPIVPATATVSMLAAAAGGPESGITYTWSLTSGPATPTFSVNGSNAAKGTVITMPQPGTYALACVASGYGSSVTSNVLLNHPSLVFTQAAVSNANPVIGASGTLSALASTGLGAESGISYTWSMVSGPNSVIFAVNGNNAAKNTTINFIQSGNYQLRCTATYQTFSATSDVKVTNTAITFTQAATVAPTPVTGATATVSALASTGLGAESGINYSWSMVSGPAAVTFAASGTNAAKNTTANFTQIGTYRLRCTASYQTLSATSDVDVQIAGITFTQAATVTPNPVTGVTATSALASAAFGAESGINYSWSMVSGPAAVTFAASGTNAAKNTSASFIQIGTYRLRCTATYQTFSATSDVDVVIAEITFIQAATVTPNPVTGTTAIVSALASYGLGAESGITYAWSMEFGPAPVTFAASGTNAAKNTTASFIQSGGYQLRCTATYQTFSAISRVYVYNDAIKWTQAATVAPSPVTGATATVSALASTGLGAESGITYTWSTVSGPAAVTFAASGTNAAKNTTANFIQIGTYRLRCTATYQTFSATSDVSVTNTAITFTQAATVTPTPVTGATATVSALASTSLGAESGITYAWSMVSGPAAVTFAASGTNAAKNTTASFIQIGTYRLRCTATYQTFSATSDVSVTNTAITFTQAATVTPTPVTGATATVSALASTGLGAESGITYAWSMVSGPAPVSFAASGTNAAKNTTASFALAGTYQLRCTATYQTFSVMSDVTTEVKWLSWVTAPNAQWNATSGKIEVSALAHTIIGNDQDIIYQWLVTAGAPLSWATNNSQGAHVSAAVPDQAGDYTIFGSAQLRGEIIYGSSKVNVPSGGATSWAIFPNWARVEPGASQIFTIQAVDRFGTPVSGVTPGVTWAANGGAITTGGVFTAGLNAGTFLMNATAGTVTKSASVTVPVLYAGMTRSVLERHTNVQSTPGGVWTGAPPGAPALVAVGPRRLVLAANDRGISGGKITLTVKAVANATVTFVCLNDGSFINGQGTVLSVTAASDGTAVAELLVGQEAIQEVIVGSSACRGSVRLVVVKE